MASTIRCARFNQNSSGAVVITEDKILTVTLQPFSQQERANTIRSSSMDLLAETTLAASLPLDESGNPQQTLQVVNLRDIQHARQVPFESPILSFKLNSAVVAVVLANKIDILGIKSLQRKHIIEGISIANAPSTVALSNYDDLSDAPQNHILAYSTTTSPGILTIVELEKKIVIQNISAHKGIIQCIALSQDGRLVATASDKGTVFRVFDTSTRANICEFRRGIVKVQILSLAFNTDSSFLLVQTQDQNAYVFDLAEGTQAAIKAGAVHQEQAAPTNITATTATTATASTTSSATTATQDAHVKEEENQREEARVAWRSHFQTLAASNPLPSSTPPPATISTEDEPTAETDTSPEAAATTTETTARATTPPPASTSYFGSLTGAIKNAFTNVVVTLGPQSFGEYLTQPLPFLSFPLSSFGTNAVVTLAGSRSSTSLFVITNTGVLYKHKIVAGPITTASPTPTVICQETDKHYILPDVASPQEHAAPTATATASTTAE